MNIKEIKEMINLMNENNLQEIELEREGLKIRLRKGNSTDMQPHVFIEKTPTAHTQTANISEPAQAVPEAKSALLEIKAPMVGTFYRAPSPDAAAFAKQGDIIDIGQVVCIIEAMKLMNEIKSEVKGIVKQVLLNNGDPIQFGQVLFLVEAN